MGKKFRCNKEESCCKSSSCDGKCDDMKCLSKKYETQSKGHKSKSCFYDILLIILVAIILPICLSLIFCGCVSEVMRANLWLLAFSVFILLVFLISICILIQNKAREESGMSAEYMHKSYAIQGFLALMKESNGEKKENEQKEIKEKLLNEVMEVIRTNPRANLDKNRNDY